MSQVNNTSTNLSSSVIVAVGLVSVALSLGFMGILYAVRRRRLRRRRQHQADNQADTQMQTTKPESDTHGSAASGGIALTRRPPKSTRRSLQPKLAKRLTRQRSSRVEYLVDEDISNGREHHGVAAISYLSQDTTPLDFHYVTEHVQCEPNIHVDSRLTGMTCCTCVDDCSNSLDCHCSKTSQFKQCYGPNGRLSSDYLLDAPEVIRECNSACKCNPKLCKNMVIQAGCRARLVLFRTKSRGWGVRTLEYLPRGTFVGVYSGELVSVPSSQMRQDDTYLFNLSSSAPMSAETNENRAREQKAKAEQQQLVAPQNEVEQEQAQHGAALLEQEPETNAEAIQQQESLEANNNNELQVDEQQMGEEAKQSLTIPDKHFVCDAKFYGNFTRFINHSCEPNVIGVRTFTVHQDDRFPYISFFTNQDIEAGAELTLNYGDSYWLVKCKRDKVFCLCKKAKCKFNKKTLPLTMKQYSEKQWQ